MPSQPDCCQENGLDVQSCTGAEPHKLTCTEDLSSSRCEHQAAAMYWPMSHTCLCNSWVLLSSCSDKNKQKLGSTLIALLLAVLLRMLLC